MDYFECQRREFTFSSNVTFVGRQTTPFLHMSVQGTSRPHLVNPLFVSSEDFFLGWVPLVLLLTPLGFPSFLVSLGP